DQDLKSTEQAFHALRILAQHVGERGCALDGRVERLCVLVDDGIDAAQRLARGLRETSSDIRTGNEEGRLAGFRRELRRVGSATSERNRRRAGKALERDVDLGVRADWCRWIDRDDGSDLFRLRRVEAD